VIASTMQEFPLTITAVLRHGMSVYADTECVTWTDAGPRRSTYGTIAANAGRLANALTRLGVRGGDRVGTFMWNSQEHMEAYLAIPSMGAVLHTLNIRLFPEQLAYVINHGEDKVVLVDDSLVPVLAKVVSELTSVECFVIVGEGDLRRSLRISRGPRSTNARPRPCVTRPARPEIRRALRTRTARPSCTRSQRSPETHSTCRRAIASS
jgi:acyl-CoA synthetase (AMP-forming)/AMP-acid ligase II